MRIQKSKDKTVKSKATNPTLAKSVEAVYQSVAEILEKARSTAYRAVNAAMVQAYWEIGCIIVEEEQKGKKRADYGKAILVELSRKLTREFGKGFDERNLRFIRQFYLTFPIRNALRSELTWTHYRLLLKVESEPARSFYEIETVNNNWSTRELERQINTLLYQRLLMSRDKQDVLTDKGQEIKEPRDLIKDPYVLEFLGLKENTKFQERDLEQLLIDKLQDFILELGKGFAFVARQKRITIDGDHFYIDLVFYNFLLKCFFLLDLKLKKLTHGDIGQMDFYVRYYEKEIRGAGDNPTMGLILCSAKNETMIKYTLLEDSQQVFAAKYKLYLPSEEELQRELNKERARIETEKRLLAEGEK